MYELPPFDRHFDPMIHNKYLSRWILIHFMQFICFVQICSLHPRKAALLERQALKKSISSECLEELLSPEKSRAREKFTLTKCILESVIFGEIILDRVWRLILFRDTTGCATDKRRPNQAKFINVDRDYVNSEVIQVSLQTINLLKTNVVSHPTLFLRNSTPRWPFLIVYSINLSSLDWPRNDHRDRHRHCELTKLRPESMTSYESCFKLPLIHTQIDFFLVTFGLLTSRGPLIGWYFNNLSTLIVASGLEKIEVPQSAAACSCDSVEKINWEYRSQIQPVIGPQEHLLIGHIPTTLAISLAIYLFQLYSISTPQTLEDFWK